MDFYLLRWILSDFELYMIGNHVDQVDIRVNKNEGTFNIDFWTDNCYLGFLTVII